MLRALFEGLPLPTGDGDMLSFSTVVVGGGPHRLGKDMSGAPALLVSLGDSRAPASPSVELQHISVQHGVRCRLWRAGADPVQATVTVVRCRDVESDLRGYFLAVLEGTLPLLGAAPSESRVREVVDALIELFRALEMPPRKSIQGLWAELSLIAMSADAAALVRAWHASPGEPYDFSDAGHRVEVKSASGEERRHYFTLVQLCPPANVSATIASLFVDAAGGGMSLGELLEVARVRVSAHPELTARLDQVVAASLGQTWRNALSERFDWGRAYDSVLFFDAGSVPSIDTLHVPLGVTEVRFRADLTHVQALTEPALRERGGLLQALLPLRPMRR